MEKIKALLFDFGGTIDTGGIHWSERFWDSYCSLNIEIQKKDYEKAYVEAERRMKNVSFSSKDSFSAVLAQKLNFQLEFLHESKILNFTPSLLNSILAESLSGIQKTIFEHSFVLKALAEEYMLGLVSNFYGNIEDVLVEYNIREPFDFVVDSTLAKVRKPDPLIYSLAVQKTGFLPEECAVIGDSYDKDIIPAKSLGCKTFWLKGRSWKEEPYTDKADYIIKSLNDLENILLSQKVNTSTNKG